MSESEVVTAACSLNFPAVLRQLDVSLLVTTYEAGRVVVLREEQGELTADLTELPEPMGCAVHGDRLAIAGAEHVRLHQREGAAWIPTAARPTGSIDVHELGFAGDGTLWAVDTAHSALVTVEPDGPVHQWMPPFVTARAREDRCHLNGLAMVDGQPGFVTALGACDQAAGWRADPAGGVVVDVRTGRTVLGDLCFPHSPRWSDGVLWLLESGTGAVVRADPVAGEAARVVFLPGFTRGMRVMGPYAVVGLSRVRDTAVFAGLPLCQRLGVDQRMCGVCVVDLQAGAVVAFAQFTAGVHEIFDVAWLPRDASHLRGWPA